MGLALENLCPLIQVFDMPASLALYRDVLGFNVIESDVPGDDCDWCLLQRESLYLMLNTRFERGQRPAARNALAQAVHGDTCFYLGCREFDSAYEFLCSRGVDVDAPVVTPYGMRQMYLRDPDGYRVCLQWRSA